MLQNRFNTPVSKSRVLNSPVVHFSCRTLLSAEPTRLNVASFVSWQWNKESRRHTLRCNAGSLSSIDEADKPVVEEPPHHTETIPDVPGSSPARLLTDQLILINAGVFVLQLIFPEITLWGVKDNAMINNGEVWRFLTAAFLHGGPLHLILNCSSLASLGPAVEWTCGRERFLMIYFAAGIFGNVLSYIGSPDNPSLGASGAIFGLAGALVVYFMRNRKLFGPQYNNLQIRLWVIILLNLSIGYFLPQIDEYGHVGGLLGGALVAYLFGPAYEKCLLKGYEGVWVVDDPPIQLITTPPRKIHQ